ncbi:unnamed protein product [Moneuplotes crassus]|uniref:Uncharacterized protein n=1 Tax=Euplotes crassus TaxID=5936 RepID=A0AAD1XI31_EUPCR|nr:unnamed protein product [Moneuplotes crassus]
MYIKNNNSSSEGSSDSAISPSQMRRRRSTRRNTISKNYNLLLSQRLDSEAPKHPQIAQIKDSLHRPIYNFKGKVQDSHVQIPISEKKLSKYQNMSKKAVPNISNFNRIVSFSSGEFTHASSRNYQNTNEILDSPLLGINDEPTLSGNFCPSIQGDLLKEMVEKKDINKYIRRKSCECTSCGGPTLKKKLGFQIVLENENSNKEQGFKNFIGKFDDKLSKNDSISENHESLSVSDQYNIKVGKISSISSFEKNKSETQDKANLQISPEPNIKSMRRLSGAGIKLLKTVFEKSQQRARVERLEKVVQIAEMKNSKQSNSNTSYIKKLKNEIKLTKIAEKKEATCARSESDNSLLLEEINNIKASMMSRLNSLDFTNKLTHKSLQINRRSSWNSGTRRSQNFNIQINYNEATTKLNNRFDNLPEKLQEDKDKISLKSQDSITSDVSSSTTSKEAIETSQMTSPKSGKKTEKITPKSGFQKSIEKHQKKVNYANSNVFNANKKKREIKRITGLLSSKPKYLTRVDTRKGENYGITPKGSKSRNVNLPKMIKTTFAKKNKIIETGVSPKFKALISSKIKNNRKTAPMCPKRSTGRFYTTRKFNPYTKTEKRNEALSSRLGSPIGFTTEISSPMSKKQDLVLRKPKFLDFAKFKRKVFHSPKNMSDSSKGLSSNSVLGKSKLEQN